MKLAETLTELHKKELLEKEALALVELFEKAKINKAGLSQRDVLARQIEKDTHVDLPGKAIHILSIIDNWDDYFKREKEKGGTKTPLKLAEYTLGLLSDKSLPVFKQILLTIASYDGPPAKKEQGERIIG